jgi:hypothetical protein
MQNVRGLMKNNESNRSASEQKFIEDTLNYLKKIEKKEQIIISEF